MPEVPLPVEDLLAPTAGMGAVTAMVHCDWADLVRSRGALPGRRQIDPLRYGTQASVVLPHLWLLDVERTPWRFRLRLIGGSLKAAGSPGKPGDYIDDVDSTGEVTQTLVGVCTSLKPFYRSGQPVLPHGGDVSRLEVLYLPLADDGRTVDCILCCTVYQWIDDDLDRSLDAL